MLQPMEWSLFKFLKEIWSEDCVGVVLLHSGGSDSQCLLYLLSRVFSSKLWPFSQPSVEVLHFHHGRRKESDQEVDFSVQEALRLGFSPTALFAFESWGSSFQAQARGWRRDQAFKLLQQKENLLGGRFFLMTGHHKDDHLETVLLNLIRGSGLRGLQGLRLCSDCGRWLKPLLSFEKHEILQYCQKNQISFCEDLSNQDLSYRRNYLRQEVIPHLKHLNPQVSEKLRLLSFDIQKQFQNPFHLQKKCVFSEEDLYNLIQRDYPDLYRVTKRSHIDNALAHIRVFSAKFGKKPKKRFRIPFAHRWDLVWHCNQIFFLKRSVSETS